MDLTRRTVLTGTLALAATPAAASAITGWREAVLIVPDLAPWIEVLTVVGGWQVAARSAPDTSLNVFWNLPAGARTEQILMHNAGTNKGFLRLVRVFGAPQVIIRPDDQAWDTGGVSALDLRVTDIEATRTALHARGWRAPSDPVRYTTYGFDDIQWVPVSPDGIRLSFIQRVSPKLTGWPELTRWSRVANAAVMTRDMAAAAAFWTAQGLRQVSHSDTVGKGANVMGLPWSFAASTPVEIRGFGSGSMTGDASVELISMPQAMGRNFAPAAHPPNFGVAALRVAGRDFGGVRANVAPYGDCALAAVTAPDGVRLEFFAPI
jgi:catechol 2,3-dioxygenase-like lactoylglutathione lyase family enzyme